MKTYTLLIALAVTGLTPLASAQPSPGNPLSGLERLKDFSTRRDSSSDPNWRTGNDDRRGIEAGATLTLAELQGPGVIAHIWFTISHKAPYYSRLLTLRMYWDGEEHPSVECPVGDFFGIGHGVDKSFVSLPLRVSSEGRGRNCYWPMPFRKSARITVSNESDVPCRSIYYYIDWQKHPSLPSDTAYFHAMYRQEHPCVMGRNYLLADIVGRGHYVGTIQSVYAMSAAWYGEGDDFFFIDGETEPSLRGTGTEDYFCDGWGFREQDGPFYGTPLWEGLKAGDRCTAYRFHLPDPVVFTNSLRVEIEHKGQETFPDGTRNGFIERDDLMSSVALWYQTEPHKPWPALPPGPKRLPFTEEMLVLGGKALKEAKHSDGTLSSDEFRKATGGKFLSFKPAESKGWLEFRFTTEKEQVADLVGNMVHGRECGRYRVTLDGQELEVMNLASEDPKLTPHRWGMRQLAAGEHVLRFECVGAPIGGEGLNLGFDAFVARVPVYARPLDFDLRKIQK
jgi:hypothetical protein